VEHVDFFADLLLFARLGDVIRPKEGSCFNVIWLIVRDLQFKAIKRRWTHTYESDADWTVFYHPPERVCFVGPPQHARSANADPLCGRKLLNRPLVSGDSRLAHCTDCECWDMKHFPPRFLLNAHIVVKYHGVLFPEYWWLVNLKRLRLGSSNSDILEPEHIAVASSYGCQIKECSKALKVIACTVQYL